VINVTFNVITTIQNFIKSASRFKSCTHL
jgi:hypothetical protein